MKQKYIIRYNDIETLLFKWYNISKIFLGCEKYVNKTLV